MADAVACPLLRSLSLPLRLTLFSTKPDMPCEPVSLLIWNTVWCLLWVSICAFAPSPPPAAPNAGKHPAERVPFSGGLREGCENGLDERLPLQPGESGSWPLTEPFAKVHETRDGALLLLCAR